jgi:hypothetical protein
MMVVVLKGVTALENEHMRLVFEVGDGVGVGEEQALRYDRGTGNTVCFQSQVCTDTGTV